MEPSKPWEMVLPCIVVDDDDNMIEEIICVSKSGGANYVKDMPRFLTLIRRREGKPDIWADYEFKEINEPLVNGPPT